MDKDQQQKTYVETALEASGFTSLNPVQKLSVDNGLFSGKNMVVSAPTASGKTIIAEMAALKTIREGKKVIYIVPLRALANEKYEEFKKKYGPKGIKTAISIGDFDGSDPWLAKFDIIIATSEKLDSLLRHGVSWIQDVGLVIADEIHLIDSPVRGPTLEIVLVRLRQLANPVFLGLSATISNYEELAGWLEAKGVKSDYRPVKLYSGVCFENEIHFNDEERHQMLEGRHTPLREIVENTLIRGKQSLIFINTRKGSESTAEQIGQYVRKGFEEAMRMRELASKVLNVLEHPTKQCHKLAECIASGTAFHHAGLTQQQRSLIEENFRKGLIKVVCATPTLAAGLNLPAYRVIVKDLKRFGQFSGMDYISVIEIQQMLGRAGRPAFDTEGEGILLPKNRGEAKYAWNNYINGEPEKIHSKLGVEPVLRTHVLALIASGAASSRKELSDFLFKTFYAYQYKDLHLLETILNKVLDMLKQFHFIEESSNNLHPTLIGKRVSELYVDPFSANHLLKHLVIPRDFISHFGLLQLISNTREMYPLPSLGKKDFEKINPTLARYESDFLELPPNPWDLEYDNYLRSIKLSSVFNAWSEEQGEDAIMEDFGLSPGELKARLDNADWMLYACQELGLLLGQKSILKYIRKTRLRIKYGVREELIALVTLKGIGRVKSRKLYQANLKGLADLRKIPMESLARIIGSSTAKSVKEQLGEI